MTAKEDCESLLNLILPMAQALLQKNKEFYPIGAVMYINGSSSFTAAAAENEYPNSQDVMSSLINAHRILAENNEIKVSGIAYNAAVNIDGAESDAILVSLEHRDGYAVTVGLPYSFGIFKKIKYGEIFAQSGNHSVF